MMPTPESVDLGIGSLSVDVGAHIAYFWESRDEFRKAVSFLERGLANGDHVVVFGHEEANALACEVLEAQGQRVEHLRRAGRLSVLGPSATGEAILDEIEKTFQVALDAGAPLIRLLGNIGWGSLEWPDERDLLRFESRVTSAAASFPCIVVCMYDIGSLEGSVIFHGAFCTHPLTIYRGNLVRENPMCVDVDEFLARLEERGGAGH